MISTYLLNLVTNIKLTSNQVETLNPDRSITVKKFDKKIVCYSPYLERAQNYEDATETDTKKQNDAKCGIILLVVGFLSQIIGNILS